MRQVFVGRRGELEVLRAKLDEVQAGRPRVALVEGPPGIGKTALIAQFLATVEVEGLKVLRATGDEQESELAYGIVDQLLAEAASYGLEAEQSDPADGGSEPLAIGARLVQMLSEAQGEGNCVVVVVDDAHWADVPSLQALTFAFRRLRFDRVLLLVISRDEAVERLPEGLRRATASERGLRVRLEGLDTAQLTRLGVGLGASDLSADLAERLRAHTAGNPLYARALLEEFSAHRLRDHKLVLPAPRSFALVVLARLSRCSPAAKELVAAASVLGVRSGLSQAAKVADLAEPLKPLEEAVTAQLLVEDIETPAVRSVAFTHPLVRAAVYHDLGPARRAELHGRAAAATSDRASFLRHRVLASPGADDSLASEAIEFGREEVARGVLPSGAAHLLLAARVTPRQTEREQLIVEAVELMILGGEAGRARLYLSDLNSFSDGPHRRHALGMLAMIDGRLVEAEQLEIAAWEACDPSRDPLLGARIANQLAWLCVMGARGEEVAEWSRHALTLMPPGSNLSATPRFNLAAGLGISGRADEGLRALSSLPIPAQGVPPQDVEAFVGRALLKLWTDDLHGAREDLTPLVDAPGGGPFILRCLVLGTLADAEFRLGAWDDAVTHGHLAASTAEDADQLWSEPAFHAVASYPLSARGRWESSQKHVQAATRVAALLGDQASLSYSATAMAAMAAARGDSQAVVEALQPLLDVPRQDGTYEPGVLPWREMLIDAFTGLGRLEDAEAVLRPFEVMAAERKRHSSLANAARSRGNLEAAKGNAQAAHDAFAEAVEHSEQIWLPFDRALVELAYGAFLRRSGQRRAAVDQLESARTRLMALDAAPYLARCEQELKACGLAPSKRRHRTVTRLTPQELAVARLVASGKTNRQVADELVVSVKTVEYHLSNVYPKLGVASRSQLASSFTARTSE
ncbi:MAG: AAA family ATPase [Actinomycetota bacterium]|nr:AAA family ATPase [Actinomycetota bacterium]